MKRKPYDTDLSDTEWALLRPLIPTAKSGGRPRSVKIREILNAIFYIQRSGCAWRLLLHEFPAWKTVYHYFRNWQITKNGSCLVTLTNCKTKLMN